MAPAYPDRLKLAASRLRKHGYDDSALDVEKLAAPGGWEVLRKAFQSRSVTPLSPTVDKRVKDALMAVRDDFEVSFQTVANEGLEAVKEGRWIPAKPVPLPPGTAQKASLSVSVDSELLEEVRELLPGLSQEAGYRVTVGGIIIGWLMEEFGVERPALPTPLTERTLQIVIPSPLRDYFVYQLGQEGLELDEVMAEGATRVLNGSWVPSKVALTSASRSTHMAKLTAHLPDRETLETLRAKAAELSASSGRSLSLQATAVAILVDRLGQPE